MSATAERLAREASRYLAAVDAIRAESNADFLRFASAHDRAREVREDRRSRVDRINDYGARTRAEG